MSCLVDGGRECLTERDERFVGGGFLATAVVEIRNRDPFESVIVVAAIVAAFYSITIYSTFASSIN